MTHTLSEHGRTHSPGHDTERAAAASLRLNSIRQTVLALLRLAPDGLTDDEGGALLRVQHPRADRLTFGRRRQELFMAGLVRDTGRRRATPAGRWAIVWTAS